MQRWRACRRQGIGVADGLGEAIGAFIDGDEKVAVELGTADTAGPLIGDAVGVVAAGTTAPIGAGGVGR